MRTLPSMKSTDTGRNPSLHRFLDLRFLILAVLFLLVYTLNARLVTGGDTLAHLYIAQSVWETGSFNLKPYEEELRQGGDLPYYVVEEGDRIRTIFPFLPGLLLLPLGPFLSLAGLTGIDGWAWAGKVMASLTTLISGFLVWFLLYRRVPRGAALLTTAAFWFATPLWPMSMSWLQHQPAILFQLTAFALVFGDADGMRGTPIWKPALAGVFLGLAVLARYQILLTAATFFILFVWLFIRHLQTVVALAAGASIPATCLLIYNRIVVGSVTDIGYVVYPWATIDAPMFPTAMALLFNPSKGLFVHSPWLLLCALPFTRMISNRSLGTIHPLLLFTAATPIPLFLVYANYTGWFGGWAWGYRLLTDVLPQLTILAGLGIGAVWCSSRLVRCLAPILIAGAFLIQSIGALFWDHEWHARHDLGTVPHQDWLWQTRHAEPLWCLERGRLYIATTPHQLRPDPFKQQGFHSIEEWDGMPTLWTAGNTAHVYIVASDHPVILRFLPAPGACDASDSWRVRISVNDEPVYSERIRSLDWHTVSLSDIPFQHGALVTIRTSALWREPGEGGRSLGVAVQLPRNGRWQ